jgi:hypothetical protein
MDTVRGAETARGCSEEKMGTRWRRNRRAYVGFGFGGAVGADGPLVLLGAVLDEAALVALLDELEVQRDHLLLELGYAGLHRGYVG